MTKNFKTELGSDLTKTKLGYYIDEVSKSERTYLNKEFEKIGITLSQFRVLNWLWRKGELTQKEIHELIQIKPSSLTNLINILIKKDLVKRTVSVEDARVRKICLTPKSIDLESDAWKVVEGLDNRIQEILTQEEYEVTTRALNKLLSSL